MTNFSPLRSEPGVLTAPGEEPRFVAALLANEKNNEVQILGADGVETLKLARIDQDGNSDRLVLVTKRVKYNWRPIREADGTWLSKLRVPVPTEAIPGLAVSGDTVPTEILSAYSEGDSPYILGVTYETAAGTWSRSGGSFIPVAGDDNTFASMDRMTVDPARAKEFLDLYDRNYVTVSDAAGYEAITE